MGTLEKVVDALSQLKEQLASMSACYSALKPVVIEEHAAIKAHDIKAVGAIFDKKNELSIKIESSFHKVFSLCEAISELHHEICHSNSDKKLEISRNIREVCDRAREIVEFDKSFAAEVLQHVLSGVENEINYFDELMKDVQPHIEENKYLLEKLTINYRASYQFFQEVAEQTTSSYDKSGVQKPKGRYSAFSAKA